MRVIREQASTGAPNCLIDNYGWNNDIKQHMLKQGFEVYDLDYERSIIKWGK